LGTNSATRIRIKNDGNVGIGTDTPGAKLDVAGTLKITDGSQAAGKVLTSDANGLAIWAAPAPSAPYYSFLGKSNGETMSFPFGNFGGIITLAVRTNCGTNRIAGGMIYYDVNSNTVSVMNSTPNAIAYIEATANVLTIQSGCGPTTFTFTNTSGVTTVTVGGAVHESKWTVLGM